MTEEFNDEGYFDNDEGEEFHFTENIDEDGYIYFIVFEGNGDKPGYEVVVSESGVSVVFDDRPAITIDTNVIPERLFPNQKSLETFQLIEIVRILHEIGFEGAEV